MTALKTYNRVESTCRSERIFTEKLVMERLNSPYILKLYRTYKDHANLYFQLEVALGGSLHKQLQADFTIVEAVAYAAELASAIHHIGNLGCIHRDVKLNNCLLDAQGHLKLSDFGSSKLLFNVDDCEVDDDVSSHPVHTYFSLLFFLVSWPY